MIFAAIFDFEHIRLLFAHLDLGCHSRAAYQLGAFLILIPLIIAVNPPFQSGTCRKGSGQGMTIFNIISKVPAL